MRHTLVLSFALALFLTSATLAQTERPDEAPKPKLSITLSGAPALDDILQVHAEYRSSDDVGFAGLIGVGSMEGSSITYTAEGPALRERPHYPLFLVGAQIHYYLFGDFDHGMQVGAQALYTTTSYEALGSYYDDGVNLSLIPYIGYKAILSPGFTLNLQGGVGGKLHREHYFYVSSYSNTIYEIFDTDVEMALMIHVNIGWTF